MAWKKLRSNGRTESSEELVEMKVVNQLNSSEVGDSPASEEDDGSSEETDAAAMQRTTTQAPIKTKRWMYKNVIGLGLAFLVVFSAFQGLQNLQTILHPEGGLGLASLSVLYAAFALFSILTPAVVHILGTKYTLLVGFLCHLIYTTSNFYPSWYTLMPASFIIGLASLPIWTAGSTHLVRVAVIGAKSLGVDQSLTISNLFGIFYFIFRLSQIPGNIASSLIFFPYSAGNETDEYMDDVTNGTGDGLCEKEDSRVLKKLYLYILVSVYFCMISAGIAIHLVIVDRLPVERMEKLSRKEWLKLYCATPVVEMLKIMKDYRMILIIPIAINNGMEQAFIFGTFSPVIVAGCFGVYLVGFIAMVWGIVGGISSAVYGKLVKWVPRFSIYLVAGSINVGCLLFLLLWSLQPSYLVVFAFIALWAVADAVWLSMTTSLVGILFPVKSEVAYSVQRSWMAVGLVVGFVCAQFLSVKGRCYLTLASVVVALVSNLVLEFKTQPREALLPWFLRPVKYSVLTEDLQERRDRLSPPG